MKNKVPKILLIYTGGTIGMVKDYKSNALKAFDFENIKIKIPELKLLDCHIETTGFSSPIDSSNMSPAYWVMIAEIIEERYQDIDGFVVLTGTDTMSYTSSALSFILENLGKPVIFTGSQLPIGDLRTDAKENLITAIQVAAAQENGEPRIKEVGLYFEYKLYRANRTTKVSSEQFEAFESPNYPHLGESGVHLNFNDPWLAKAESEKPLRLQKNFDASVVILKLFPGINKNMVEHILNCPDLEGVILETYGAGNAQTDTWFTDIIIKTIERNIPVINVTQCISGSVLMGHYETSVHLKNAGVISGKNITTESAIAKLKLLLGLKIPFKKFKREFEHSLRGELD
ncbi:asparaginase [Lutimonas vermicola]|uniref:Asparaginase n=1 Tax=Lutimonas vermicola TaxID=414288 RepID=A0ABU9L2A1_9FLAO